MDKSPNTSFWVALLEIADEERRKRLWNGYLGQNLPEEVLVELEDRAWSPKWIEPPADGWPQLTDEDIRFLDNLASEYGGYPVFRRFYMDFQGHRFHEAMDFSDLTLVDACFSRAMFEGNVSFRQTRFFRQAWFTRAMFKQQLFLRETRFAVVT